ncbi:MAG: OB-fold nucleic acid binding domain-containing protein [Dehalococcoidia bacterium]
MAAVLQAANGSSDRIAPGIAECTRLGVPVLQPDVNASEANFSIERLADGTDAIRFGLAQIKNVGLGGVEALIAERDARGDFLSVEDFARRVPAREMNKRVLESLAKAGALDTLASRGAVITSVDRILSLAQQEQKLRDTGQTSMFDMFGDEVNTPLPGLELTEEIIPLPQLLGWEKELLGTYVSEHPFRAASQRLARHVTHQAVELTEDLGGQDAVIAGTVINVRSLTTKQGKAFAAVTIEDLSGQCEITFWSTEYEAAKTRGVLFEGNVILAKVAVRPRGGRVNIAALEVCAYDYEAGRLAADFAPAKFTVRAGFSAARFSAGPAFPNPPGGPPAGPGGPSGGPRERSDARPDLRIVRPSADTAPAEAGVAEAPETYSAPSSSFAPARRVAGGPHRLLVTMDETTDEAADRRRVARLCAVLDEFTGDLPVELCFRVGGTESRFARGAVDAARLDTLVPRLKALLGVLGDAVEAGDAEPARRESGFVAVGGA